MATGDVTWRVGTITTPASGNVAVTGLGGTPKAVFFFGTNWTTEDSAITTNGSGMFRGMAAPEYDSPGTILQNAATICMTPAGNAHYEFDAAIWQLGTSGAAADIVYSAAFTSFDADGFTVAFDAGGSGYKIVYVAMMEAEECGAFIGTYNNTITLGWKAGASLLHGAWSGPTVSGDDRTQEFYGGGAYPTTTNTNWFGAGLTAMTFPLSGSAQYVNEIPNDPPHIRVATGGHFTGPFLVTSNIIAYPDYAGSINDFVIGGDSQDGGMVVIWDDEDSQTGNNTPATSQGNTTTVTGLPFEPGLLITYTISDEPSGQGTGGRGAAGMSVVTPKFQWCATIDGHSSQGAFQSFQRGFADVVNGSSVHAGTVELTDDGFIMTTEEDDVSPVPIVWHAFGHPLSGVWIPQIYRRVVPG